MFVTFIKSYFFFLKWNLEFSIFLSSGSTYCSSHIGSLWMQVCQLSRTTIPKWVSISGCRHRVVESIVTWCFGLKTLYSVHPLVNRDYERQYRLSCCELLSLSQMREPDVKLGMAKHKWLIKSTTGMVSQCSMGIVSWFKYWRIDWSTMTVSRWHRWWSFLSKQIMCTCTVTLLPRRTSE